MDGDSTSSGNARRRAVAPEPQRTHDAPEVAARPAPETEAPGLHPGATSALLHDARLDARANSGVRAGLYIAMQRDYGNRAARRARDQARAGATARPAAAGSGAPASVSIGDQRATGLAATDLAHPARRRRRGAGGARSRHERMAAG